MNIQFGNFNIYSDEYGIHLVVDNVTHLMSGEELGGPMHTYISVEDAAKASVALAAMAQFAQAAPWHKEVKPAPPGSARAAINAALAALEVARVQVKPRGA